jgi:hypothetical protein
MIQVFGRIYLISEFHRTCTETSLTSSLIFLSLLCPILFVWRVLLFVENLLKILLFVTYLLKILLSVVLILFFSSHEYDRDFDELNLLDSKPVCVALGCSDFVVAHGRCQLHIDEFFDISALFLFTQEEPLVVIECRSQ